MKALRTRAAALWMALALAGVGGMASAQTVHVVTEDTSQSFMQDGRVVGRATEVVEATLQRAGIADYRIDLYPWARAQDLASREPYVLIYLIARTPEREHSFRWVGEIRRVQYHLYALPGRNDLNIARLDDARAWSIGVVRDDVRQQYLQRRGFTRLVTSAEPQENLRKLLYRQIDLIALSDFDARAFCNEASAECPGLMRVFPLDELRTGLYMAFSLATPPEVASRTRAAFESLRADGTVMRLLSQPQPVPARRSGS